MYLLQFSRYDCPGCDKSWYFDTIEDIETFIKDAYPKFPETEWKHGHEFYPNGLSISECVGRYPVLKMWSMVDAHDFDYEMPDYLSPEFETVAKLIYDLQGIVDLIQDGEDPTTPPPPPAAPPSSPPPAPLKRQRSADDNDLPDSKRRRLDFD